jgi:hypothetical protein
MRKTPLVFAAALVALSMSGCDKDDGNLIKRAPGVYDGFIIRKEAPHADQEMVTGKITLDSPQDLTVKVTAGNGKTLSEFMVHAESLKKIHLTAQGLFAGSPALLKDSKNCFSTPATSSGVTQLRLCYDGAELSIDHVVDANHEYIYVLDRHNDADHPALETPRTYSVPELLQLGKNKSFTSQIQFQNSRMSHLNAQTAHMNLLPHFSYATISSAVIGAITGNWAMLLNTVGDLAPFLVPSNWINAKAATFQSNADYYAWLLMKADSGNIAEGLAYVVLRDKAAYAALAKYEAPLSEMRDIVHEKEVLGLVPQGSADSLSNMLSSLQTLQIRLKKVIAEEKRALSFSVGLINPEAVDDVTDVTDLSLETPVSLDTASIQNLVIDRSMELRQLDSLVHVAKENALNRWFSWVTPSTSASIGFGLPSSIQAGKIPVMELMIQRQQLQATLIQKVENSADEYNASLRTYALAKENSKILEDRVDLLRQGMINGLAVSVTDIQVALGDKMKGETDLIDAQYTYYAAVGKFNRMLLAGPYLDILTRVGENHDAPRP